MTFSLMQCYLIQSVIAEKIDGLTVQIKDLDHKIDLNPTIEDENKRGELQDGQNDFMQIDLQLDTIIRELWNEDRITIHGGLKDGV